MTKETQKPETVNQEAHVDPEELVEYQAPLVPGSSNRDIVVGVNGEFIQIKRGETVKIKRKFLEVLESAAAQERAAYEAQAAAMKASERAIADL